MNKNNTYTIPYRDKFIIYQPLNKFAFIGNSAMIKLIDDIFDNKEIDEQKNKNVLTFLNSYGVFNHYNTDTLFQKVTGYSPTVGVLCMTSACNFRCSYCFANGGQTKFSELSLETGKKAIDIVYNNSVSLKKQQFVISYHGGGEPSLLISAGFWAITITR